MPPQLNNFQFVEPHWSTLPCHTVPFKNNQHFAILKFFAKFCSFYFFVNVFSLRSCTNKWSKSSYTYEQTCTVETVNSYRTPFSSILDPDCIPRSEYPQWSHWKEESITSRKKGIFVSNSRVTPCKQGIWMSQILLNHLYRYLPVNNSFNHLTSFGQNAHDYSTEK